MENWEGLTWAFVQYSALAIIIERALYVIFEWDAWRHLETRLQAEGAWYWLDLKPPISIAAGIGIAFALGLDIPHAIVGVDASAIWSTAASGLVLAGGSKGVFVMLARRREIRDAVAEKAIGE